MGLLGKFSKKMTPHVDVSAAAKEDPLKSQLIPVAISIENAIYGYNLSHKKDLTSLTLYAWYNSGLVFYSLRFVVLLHMFLAFLERPYANARNEIAPIPVTLVLEALCLLAYVVEIILKLNFQEWKKFFGDRKEIAQIVVLILTAIDMVISIGAAATNTDYPRWSRILRPYFFIHNVRSVRVAFRDIRNSAGQVAIVLILIFGLVIFYTQFCVIFYLNSREGDLFFPDIFDGFFNLYVLLTTANFPDVMIPAYTENRWNALIFISFLVLGLYMLLNFVLAIIYQGYRTHLRDEVYKAFLVERQELQSAYSTLVQGEEPPVITPQRWLELFSVLRPHYDEEKIRLLFKLTDKEGNGTLNYQEFLDILVVLNWKIEPKEDVINVWDKCCPAIYRSKPFQWLRDYVVLHKSGWFAYLIDLVIFTNAVVTLVQLQITASSPDTDFADDRSSEWVFFAIYLIELILKLIACGPIGYWKHDWNKFDLFVLVGTFVDLVISASGQNVTELRIFLVLRMLRLARLTGHIAQFRILTRTMFTLIPIVVSYAGVVLCLYYVFAILGMEIWGGLITPSNPDLQDPNIPFVIAGYFPNNFNTFGEAIILLFELTVVNNWQVNVSGFVAVSSRFAYIYFIVFHLLAVLIIFNVLVGIVIENFQIQYEAESGPGDELEKRISEGLPENWKGHPKSRLNIGNLIKRQLEQQTEIVDVADDHGFSIELATRNPHPNVGRNSQLNLNNSVPESSAVPDPDDQ